MNFLRGLFNFCVYFGCSGFFFYIFFNREGLDEVEATLVNIGLFAVAVATIGLAMPMLDLRLPKLPVDTIYYGSAILATVVLFVGNANDRAVLSQRASISEKRVELRTHEDTILHLSAALQNHQQNRITLEGNIESALGTLESLEARALIEREVEVARELERQTGLAQFWEEIDTALARCRTLEQRLELERATNSWARDSLSLNIDTGLDMGIRPGEDILPLPDPGPTLEQIRFFSELTENVAACAVLRSDHESIFAEPTGYTRLFALEDLRRSSAYNRISGNQINPELDPEIRNTMNSVLEVLNAQELAARGPGALQSASDAIEETNATLANLEDAVEDVQQTIAQLEGDLEQLEDQPMVGLLWWAKEQGTVTWPFLLIMMLGMKLAREPLF